MSKARPHTCIHAVLMHKTYIQTQELPDIGLAAVRLERAGERVVAAAPTFLVESFITWAATRPLVRWVDAVENFTPLDLVVAQSVQASGIRDTPIWDRGITGQNQTVGLADTVRARS